MHHHGYQKLGGVLSVICKIVCDCVLLKKTLESVEKKRDCLPVPGFLPVADVSIKVIIKDKLQSELGLSTSGDLACNNDTCISLLQYRVCPNRRAMRECGHWGAPLFLFFLNNLASVSDF